MGDRDAVRIAVLLPLSARQPSVRAVAESLLNAAQLALFEFGNPNVLLIPKDTRGTNSGAEGAAREALQEGAELILGPLFAGSVTAVRPIAAQRNVPVIAFSSDSSVAGNGVYLLSFLPEQDVDRVVDYAGLQGLTVFAGMVPQNSYGSLMRQALTNAVTARAGEVYSIESYPNRAEAMFEPARRLALYDDRKRALAKEKARLATFPIRRSSCLPGEQNFAPWPRCFPILTWTRAKYGFSGLANGMMLRSVASPALLADGLPLRHEKPIVPSSSAMRARSALNHLG